VQCDVFPGTPWVCYEQRRELRLSANYSVPRSIWFPSWRLTAAPDESLFCRPFFLPQKPAQEKFAAVGLAQCCRARQLLLETKCESRSGAVGARGRFGVAIL